MRASYRLRQRGSVFVLTLAVLAGLVAILASVAATQQANRRAQINRQESQRARLAAQSGIQRAIATLALIGQNGQTSTGTTSTANSASATTNQDDWAVLGQTGAENFIVDNGSFRLQVLDASSRINVNSATEDQLNRLPLTQEEIASLIDYRSTNREPSALGGKDEYYNGLTEPYNAKLNNFETVDELLQVKGFTAKILFEPRTDVQSNYPAPEDAAGNQLPLSEVLTAVSYSSMNDPSGQAKINVNVRTNGPRIQQIPTLSQQVKLILVPPNNQPPPTFANMGALIRIATSASDLQAILDYLTVDNSTRKLGRININTASQSVLETIPGITPDIASSIVGHQSTGFASLGEIATIPGVTADVLSQAVDLLTASSQTFMVRVIGKAGQTQVALEAIVDVQNGQPKVLYVQEPPISNADVITQWGWQDETTTETVLKEAA